MKIRKNELISRELISRWPTIKQHNDPLKNKKLKAASEKRAGPLSSNEEALLKLLEFLVISNFKLVEWLLLLMQAVFNVKNQPSMAI